MSRVFALAVLFGWLLIAFPMFAADGNIYITGHDLDYHCGVEAAAQCNAFKIAIALARAGNPTKKLLFVDEGMSTSIAGHPAGTFELALAAANIGLLPDTDF